MSELTLRIMMIGGRRCGKTSILASMKSCFANTLGNTKLTITSSNNDTMEMLDRKKEEIDLYYKNKLNLGFVPDDNPSKDSHEYCFDVGITGKKSNINLIFYDFPGEWLQYEKKSDILSDEIKKSDVIMVAIDTPHLMEASGVYCNNKNNCLIITELLKSNFNKFTNEPKVVLFVPLKSERYRIQKNRHIDLNDVQYKIRNDVYKELINDLSNKGNITIAITPIFTMGTAEFDKFERDENGKVKLVDISQNQNKFIPEKPVYHFTSEAYSDGIPLPQCKPIYCEQPLIYILE